LINDLTEQVTFSASFHSRWSIYNSHWKKLLDQKDKPDYGETFSRCNNLSSSKNDLLLSSVTKAHTPPFEKEKCWDVSGFVRLFYILSKNKIFLLSREKCLFLGYNTVFYINVS